MTKYLDAADLQRLLAQVGVEPMMAQMAQYLREDFLRWESYQKSPRTANHSRDGVIELMPVSDETFFAFKYVNGHPTNPLRRLSTVMAFGVLADMASGYPLLLSELTLTTALRTAATSVVAARVLARANSRSMALIGNGAQSEFQAIAFMDQLGIRDIRAYDIDPQATHKLVRNLAPYLRRGQLEVTPVSSVREAVAGADIITTITADKANATILTPDMIAPGMHINAVGGDCPGKTELDARILHLGPVVVEFEPQTRIEGELQQMPAEFPVIALSKILQGLHRGRVHDGEITIFDSVGFALEDLSALRLLRQLASDCDIGQTLEIIPQMPDPKDLYGWATHSPSPLGALASRPGKRP